MTATVISFWVLIILLPSILLILSPLIDQIITNEVIDRINIVLWYIDTFLWSTWTNILFATIWIIIVMPMLRRFFSFFTWNNNE